MTSHPSSAAGSTERTSAGGGRRLAGMSRRAAREVGRLRLPELVLFTCLIFEGSLFGIPLPFNQLVMIAIIGLGAIRRTPLDGPWVRRLLPFMVVALFYIALVSLFADPTADALDWRRRLIRLSLTCVLILVVAGGRIDLRSALTGLGIGLIGNAVLFYAGIAPDYYDGVLSGYFEDKNVAGLTYTVLGVLLISAVRGIGARVVLTAVFGALVWLTGSRTSISAFAAGLVWLLVAARLPVAGRWVLGALIYVGVDIASEDFSQVGRFSDREGSDLLRARIDAASEIKVGQAGILGDGLGEAYVVFADDDSRKVWLFHNSYWSALVEGGWPWLVMILALTLVMGLRPLTGRLSRGELGAQAATVALLICAWRLGEVLFTLQWAIVMGYALVVRSPEESPPVRSPSGARR